MKVVPKLLRRGLDITGVWLAPRETDSGYPQQTDIICSGPRINVYGRSLNTLYKCKLRHWGFTGYRRRTNVISIQRIPECFRVRIHVQPALFEIRVHSDVTVMGTFYYSTRRAALNGWRGGSLLI